MCCVNMWVYGNREPVLYVCVYVCVWLRGHRWRKKEGERGERKWDRQQRYKLSTCSVLLLLSAATEGKRRRSPTPISTQSTCRRPCSSWIRRPLPSVCLPRTPPSRCHLSAAGARLHRHERRGAVPPDAHFLIFFPPAHAVPKMWWQSAPFYVSESR